MKHTSIGTYTHRHIHECNRTDDCFLWRDKIRSVNITTHNKKYYLYCSYHCAQLWLLYEALFCYLYSIYHIFIYTLILFSHTTKYTHCNVFFFSIKYITFFDASKCLIKKYLNVQVFRWQLFCVSKIKLTQTNDKKIA